MPSGYVPEAGDIVWMTFDSQLGREQAGHGPAVVLSPARYNARVGRLICCPTTTKVKGYPFEVPLSGSPASVALADQVKSFDWRSGKAARKGRATNAELAQIKAKLHSLIG